jgi:putative DNA primase/helicase
MFQTVEPWPEEINADQLLHEIHKTMRRFIVCSNETAITATLWIAFTWFIDQVQVAPLAVITAPEKRCGKSQLLNLFSLLCYRALVASNIAPAAVYRIIEAHAPTLLIDEADSFMRDNEELRGVINSGHTRQSAYVIRCVGDDHEPRQFSTWGAKALSGIGHLPETIMDRAVILELRRKLPSESVTRLRHADPEVFKRLASKLARFAADSAHAIKCARPALPDELNDRAQDNWEPLLAIADCAGGDWPRLGRMRCFEAIRHGTGGCFTIG